MFWVDLWQVQSLFENSNSLSEFHSLARNRHIQDICVSFSGMRSHFFLFPPQCWASAKIFLMYLCEEKFTREYFVWIFLLKSLFSGTQAFRIYLKASSCSFWLGMIIFNLWFMSLFPNQGYSTCQGCSLWMKRFSRLKTQFIPVSGIKISSPSRGPSPYLIHCIICWLWQKLSGVSCTHTWDMCTLLNRIFHLHIKWSFPVAQLSPVHLLNIIPVTRGYDNGLPIYSKDKGLLLCRRWLSIPCLSSCIMTFL